MCECEVRIDVCQYVCLHPITPFRLITGVCLCACACVSVCVNTHICVCVPARACVSVCVNTHICVCVCARARMCVSVYVFMHVNTRICTPPPLSGTSRLCVRRQTIRFRPWPATQRRQPVVVHWGKFLAHIRARGEVGWRHGR